MHIIVTGEWSLPVREAEATNALVDAGCDVIATRVDSPKIVVETAETRGVKRRRLRCLASLAGAQRLHHWRGVQVGHRLRVVRRTAVRRREAAEHYRGRLRQGLCAEHTVRRRRERCGKERGARCDGRPHAPANPIFVGPVRTNGGKVVSDKTLDLYDGSLWGTDYLVEGIVGSVT